MKPIQILLLGPPQVTVHEQPVPLPASLGRGLLFVLAANGGSAPRDYLASLLAEKSSPQGEPTERQAVLDQALETLEQVWQGPALFTEKAPWLRLDQEAAAWDQAEFQDLLDRWGRQAWQVPSHAALPPDIYSALASAASLWRAPHYMAGYTAETRPLQDWLDSQRRSMERLYGRVLQRLADHHLAAQEIEQALEFNRQALQVDPLNEELHEQHLRALIDLGRVAEAAAHFTRLQAQLMEESGSTPSAALVRQYGRILSAAPGQAAPLPEPEWKLHHSLGAPFVGRQEVLDRLDAKYQQGGGLLLTGESGGGKTRLLQEFIRRRNSRPRVFLSHCLPQENELPFKPLLEALRFQIQPDEWLGLAPAWASQLSLLLPELRAMRPELDPPPIAPGEEALPQEAISSLFEAVRQLLLLVANKQQRLFLCLDDAQWADDASLRALEYLLLRPPFDQRGLLLLAARSEELSPSLETWSARLTAAGNLERLELERLATAEIRQLAENVLAKELPPTFIAHLERETGGNPLYILESLSAVREVDPRLWAENGAYMPLSGSLKNLIIERLKRLPPLARQALAAAATAGLEFDPQVVGQVLEQPQQTLQVLRELEQRGLVEPLLGSTLRYTFVHNKIREAVLDDLQPLHKRELHKKTARALEAAAGPDQAVILAEHCEQGGEPGKAFEHWLAAARWARQMFSTNGNLQALEHAAQCADLAPNIPDEQIKTLYLEWIEACYVNEDVEGIERTSRKLMQIGRERGSPRLVGEALNGLCDALLASNQFQKGLELAEETIDQLASEPLSSELVEAYNHYATFLYLRGQVKSAISWLKKALVASSSRPDPYMQRARANASYHLAVVQVLCGQPAAALRHAQRSLEDYTALNRYMGMVNALSVMSMARYYRGEFKQARQDCERGLELAKRIGVWRMLGYLHTYYAMIVLALGELDNARQNALQGIEIGERYQHGEMIAGGYHLLADLHLWLRDPLTAASYAHQAREHGKNTFMELQATPRLGLALALLNQEEGIEVLQHAEQQAAHTGVELVQLEAQVYQIVIRRLHGPRGKPLPQTKAVLREIKRRSLFLLEHLMHVTHARIALENGKHILAVKDGRTAARAAQTAHFPWMELMARTTLYTTARVAQGPTSQQAEREYQRIQRLLAELEAQAESPDLLQGVAHLRNSMQQRIEREIQEQDQAS
jgi:DNA-binding SARP family transcriptional activator/ATP/maltotriose-dependent transcriptional regulator MalT